MPMPNQYRDPKEEMRRRFFLQNGGGPSFGYPGAQNLQPPVVEALPPSQNPLSTPTATPEERAEVAGAAMRSKIPQTVADMSDYSGELDGLDEDLMDHEPYESIQTEGGPRLDMNATPDLPDTGATLPETETVERAGKELDVDRPSDDRYQKLLEQELLKNPNPFGGEDAQYMADRAMNTRSADRNLGLLSLFAKSAAQASSSFGKMPSAEPAAEMIQGLQANNKAFGESYTGMGKASEANRKILAEMAKAEMANNVRREGFGVQREGHQIQKMGFENAERRANQQISAMLGKSGQDWALGMAKIDAANNRPARPLTAMEQHELQMAKEGKDKFGNKVTPKKPAGSDSSGLKRLNATASQTYDTYIAKGGRSKLDENITKLSNVIREIRNDANASGPGMALIPDKLKTAFGNRGPEYQRIVEGIIGQDVKELAGPGPVTDYERKSILANQYDPALTPEQNVKRLESILRSFEKVRDATDQYMQHYEDNNFSMEGFKSGASSSGSGAGGGIAEGTVRVQNGNRFVYRGGQWQFQGKK